MTERIQMWVFLSIKAVSFKAPVFVHRRSNADADSLLDGYCNSGLAKHHGMLSEQDAFSRSACFYQHMCAA